MVEDDPDAKKKKKSKKPKGYAGSKTSRYEYPDQSSGLYDAGTSVSDHSLSNTLKPAINSNMNESRSYDPVSTTKYQPENPKGENRKPKSRYKKYGGAKTSYGDIGGASYANPGVSGRNVDSNRYKTSYDDSSSRREPYQSGKYGSSHQYNAGRYDNKYNSGSGSGGGGGYGGDAGSSSRYGGNYHSGGYNQSKYGNYGQSRPEYGGRSNEGNSRNYGSGYKSSPSKYSSSSAKYGSPGSYYQPVAAKYYDTPKRYDPQPQYADVKPTLVDTHPKHTPNAPQPHISTFESRATLQLQKEDSPEHSVSDAIEKKATRYGGKYETKDGKIYYGGKPSKYSGKRGKKYNQRRKTMHPEPEETEKSDRTSV